MSTQKSLENSPDNSDVNKRVRVCALVDGFNMYHSLDGFDRGGPLGYAKYQKYKWLCLASLAKKFLTANEILGSIKYFTAFPNWDPAKLLRHETYVSAQRYYGVEVIKGEFRNKRVVCRADGGCKREFVIKIEKQTDVNIAVSIIKFAPLFDKLLLFTGDSDQIPAVKLFKHLYREKRIGVVIPIGRNAEELAAECDEAYRIEEQHLIDSQLPNPIEVVRNGKVVSRILKPTTWP